METRLLTIQEVADLFRVGPETVSRWMERGVIPVVRVNRKVVRFRPADVEALLERSTTREI